MRIPDLRHSFASLLVSGGRSLHEVQQILGHIDPKVTMRYAHLSTKASQAVANWASVIMSKVPKVSAALPAGPAEAATSPTGSARQRRWRHRRLRSDAFKKRRSGAAAQASLGLYGRLALG